MYDVGSETDSIDPRVHIELERLNSATDEINRLEVELDDARIDFRLLLCEGTQKTDSLKSKLGMCVERAKPYYEARIAANEAFKSTQQAAIKFEKANSSHRAAREMVFLAEQGLGGRTLDPAWQEMLNHATQRVNEAEKERTTSGAEHRLACIKHEAACVKVQALQKDLKRAISKSRPYYEAKAHYNTLLEQYKNKIQNYESQVSIVKLTYAEALRNLEQISDEIHTRRRNSSIPSGNYTKNNPKRISVDSNESLLDDAQELITLDGTAATFTPHAIAGASSTMEFHRSQEAGISPTFSTTPSENIGNPISSRTQSSEWIEISLENSSPEEELFSKNSEVIFKQPLTEQITSSNNMTENDCSIKNKIKLDSRISNWISRSSLSNDNNGSNGARRQSLDNLLGPTSEKMKGMLSQGMMLLNIGNSTERRNSEPKLGLTEERPKFSTKKLPSPLEKTLTYLSADDDTSDTESLSRWQKQNRYHKNKTRNPKTF
ncbi:SH3 domain-binding protein 5-like isoform X2 [Harmonia axyridis]|uniref:SH3 domain-binding protein 5-like isoform X2 n=1 Tax=Harmonia axyridis TaxID=115357 RepID=UPI001E275BC7|nr:SH3 domain-binding protein 5-like isoform X2 [Harmonia axyridis]